MNTTTPLNPFLYNPGSQPYCSDPNSPSCKERLPNQLRSPLAQIVQPIDVLLDSSGEVKSLN